MAIAALAVMSNPNSVITTAAQCRLRVLANLSLTVLSLLLAFPVFGQSALPTGFGGINLGDNWTEIQSQHNYQTLDEMTDSWDDHIRACGYETVLIETEKGELLVTVQNFVVISLSFSTAIQPGSDLLQVADLVMQTYGQPDRAAMRNLFGRIKIGKEDVNFVLLEYHQPQRVEFTISGRGLWRYQIQLRHQQFRWHQSESRNCARALDKKARELAQQAAQSGS